VLTVVPAEVAGTLFDAGALLDEGVGLGAEWAGTVSRPKKASAAVVPTARARLRLAVIQSVLSYGHPGDPANFSGSTPYAATGIDEPEPGGHSDLDSRVLTAAGQSRTCTGFPHGVQVTLTLSHAIAVAPRGADQETGGIQRGEQRGTAGRVAPAADVVLLAGERVR